MGNCQLIVRQSSADDFSVCDGADLLCVRFVAFLIICIFIGYFCYIYAILKNKINFFKKHQGELLQTPRCFGHNTKVFALKHQGVSSQNIRCFASNTKVFFFSLPCFCEKSVSPSLIRFLLFGLFMHKVAIIDYSW